MNYKISHTADGKVRVREAGYQRIQRATMGLGASALVLTGALSVGLATTHAATTAAPASSSTTTATSAAAGVAPTATGGTAPVAVTGGS